MQCVLQGADTRCSAAATAAAAVRCKRTTQQAEHASLCGQAEPNVQVQRAYKVSARHAMYEGGTACILVNFASTGSAQQSCMHHLNTSEHLQHTK